MNGVSHQGAGQTFVSGGSDGFIYRITVGESDPELVGTVEGAISMLCPVPSSDELLVGLESGRLVVISLDSGESAEILEFHTGPVSDIGGSAGLDWLLTTSYDGTIGVWNAHEWRIREKLVDDALVPVTALAVDPQGQWFVTGGVDAPIRVWSTESSRPTRTLGDASQTIVDLAVTPDGGTLLSLDYSGTLEIWDPDLWASTAILDIGAEGENVVAVHPDAPYVAVGKGESVSIYEFTGDISSHFEVGTSRIACLDFSADGQRLGVGCEDGRVSTLEIDLWYQQDTYHLPR